MNRPRLSALWTLPLLTVLSPAVSRADCSPPTGASTCIDADTLWPALGPSRFVGLPALSVTPAGKMGFGLVTTYLRRPIAIEFSTAATAQVRRYAVDDLVDATFMWSLGLGRRWDVGIALPFTAYRTGSGVSLLTSEHSQSLPQTGLRDVRLGAGYALVQDAPLGQRGHIGLVARLDLTLPTGDQSAFAADRSLVLVPQLAGGIDCGRLSVQMVVGARLRDTSNLLGTRIGPQLWLGLGAAVHLDAAERYRLAAEVSMLPTLAGQYVSDRDVTKLAGSSPRVELETKAGLVPTEWLVTAQAKPFGAFPLALVAGGGGPIDFGDLKATMPNIRAVVALRYVPEPPPQETPPEPPPQSAPAPLPASAPPPAETPRIGPLGLPLPPSPSAPDGMPDTPGSPSTPSQPSDPGGPVDPGGPPNRPAPPAPTPGPIPAAP